MQQLENIKPSAFTGLGLSGGIVNPVASTGTFPGIPGEVGVEPE